MPVETQQAVDWALTREIITEYGSFPITKDTPGELVDKVREYFNTNQIEYLTFSYTDLKPYL